MIAYFLIGFILGVIVSIFVWRLEIKDLSLHDPNDIQKELSDFLPYVIVYMIIFTFLWPIAIIFIIIYIIMFIIACKNKNIKINKNKSKDNK